MTSRYVPPAKSVSDLHRAWLELVDSDGPFLSVPALKRVWPQGMPQLSAESKAALSDAKPAFEKAWDVWDNHRDDPAALADYRDAREIWVAGVFANVLGWGESYTTDLTGAALADLAKGVRSPNYAVTVTPTGALIRNGVLGAAVIVVDPVDSLRDPLEDGWATSPIDRMEELLRATNTQVGVVTDGRWWAIVSAQQNTTVASGVVDAQTWIEDQTTTGAFVELLQRRRLLGGKAEDRLPRIFADSVAAAEEITLALGVQVRRAVELLVQAFSEAALEARRQGHPDPLPARRHDVYEAAVTVMMRVVFLLFAEERGLLPQGRLFAKGYGISDELDGLDQRARDEHVEALDSTQLTWHRLLATSLALYRGATFEDMRLPSYGGSLFDPTRFPFLTARTDRATLAVPVNDRVMLEVLRAVQMAQLRGEPARPISFRDIDVEQIGYIYEGLLGYSCAEVDEVTVGLTGTAGAEPELSLAELESLYAEDENPERFADAVLAAVKQNQPAAKPPTRAALVKAIRASKEITDADRALRAVTTDPALRDRLMPFIGITRRDLRDRPLVVQPGGLVVVETPSRATAGAHYTPRSLAEEVVEHALEPLVFSPGPHETADRDAWVPVSSDRILDLKVADIACGSGAFLVAAARYLAARLIEAWHRDGVAVGTPHQQQVSAIRKVVASCLYGADINGMAVEMCKLSLWLVSLDSKLPFSFVDDKVLHGNSLLGLIDPQQIKAMHIAPNQALAERLFDIGEDDEIIRHLDVDGVIAKAIRLRRQLASEVDDADPQRSAATKRREWRDYKQLTRQLSDVADGIVAAGLSLGGKPGRTLNEAYENLRIAVGRAYGDQPDRTMLDGTLAAGLTPTVKTDYDQWKPLHWILLVPDVVGSGGFDAVIGNPPFRGSTYLTGDMGENLREWLVHTLAKGQRGKSDLVGYFLLRASDLTAAHGTLGLIATNTVAQGETREVGLDRMTTAGLTITRAIQSRSWPASGVNLEYAAIWGTYGAVSPNAERFADDVRVTRISTLLEAAGRVDGYPARLRENSGMSFEGCKPYGMGFLLSAAEAAEWITIDPKNKEVLYPYLVGEDLNSRSDLSSSRWIIDFNDRSEAAASAYNLPYERVRSTVKAERQKVNRKALRDRWWQYGERRPAMRRAISGLDDLLVITRVSKTVMPARVSAHQVLSDLLTVFSIDSFADQAVLSSSFHQAWAIKYSSGMRNDPRYAPSDAFETFPRPKETSQLIAIGQKLELERRRIMTRRTLGLTKLYNLVNDSSPSNLADPDVGRLREIHVEVDHSVMAAYGWAEVPLDHGFHTYRQMERWTVSPAARVTILDRLLEENHKRAAAQGEAPPIPADDETGDQS